MAVIGLWSLQQSQNLGLHSGLEIPGRKGVVSAEWGLLRYAQAKEPLWPKLQLIWPCDRILTDLLHKKQLFHPVQEKNPLRISLLLPDFNK